MLHILFGAIEFTFPTAQKLAWKFNPGVDRCANDIERHLFRGASRQRYFSNAKLSENRDHVRLFGFN